MLETGNSCVLDIYRAGETIRISAYEKTLAAEQTLKHYEERKISFVEIEKLCKDTVVLLNRANKRGEMAPGVLDDLKKVGQTLYDELLTAKAKNLLRSTSSDYLVLYMDDQLVHIPWELLFDGEEFLCLKFSVGRIVSTKQSAGNVERRKINNPPKMLIIADPQGNLEAAYKEGIRIRDEFGNLEGIINVNLAGIKVETQYIKKNIRDFDIVHYAGHADYNPMEPSQSGWLLHDGRWTAADIVKMTSSSMPALVFSNACHSGRTEEWHIREGFESEIYGLANAFLLSGVTHYIGTFWEILDSPSSLFAIELYKTLGKNCSIGESVRLARQHLIARFGKHNIIWASYMLYGDPAYKIFKKASFVKAEEKRELASVGKDITSTGVDFTQKEVRLRSSGKESHVKSRLIPMKGIYALVAILVLFLAFWGIKGLKSFYEPPKTVTDNEYLLKNIKTTPLELSMNIIGQREESDGTVSEVLIKEGSILHSYDNFQIHFHTNKDAFVYALIYDSSNEAHQLFPDPKIALNNNVKSGTEYSVPTAGQWFWLDENIGTETIYVLASENPLNNIQDLLKKMEGVNANDKKKISEKIKNEIRSLERGVGGITEGKSKSFNLKDGKTIQSVTEIVKGTGAVVRAISFRHIDKKLQKNTQAFKSSIKKTGQGQSVFESQNNLLKNTVMDFIGKRSNVATNERTIDRSLKNLKKNVILEESRGVGGIRVYKQIAPAVVLVVTNEGIGSGSVLDKQGNVITNWHVIKGYERVVVFFKPQKGIEVTKENAYTAKIVKVDEIADLALLKIARPPANVPTIKLGSIEKVEVAQEVHAIGHPEGEIWTYTKGIISQIRPEYEWSYDDRIKHKSKVVQTQTPINPGNSGGPLLNNDAEFIGINSFVKRGEGLNFAVSVDVVKEFIKRKESRFAQKPSIKKLSLADVMKGSKYYEFDVTKDGITDGVAVDTNSNGKFEILFVDLNQDRIIDYIGLDVNENGLLDARGYDTDNDGIYETWAYDTDEDGKVNFYGLDYDGDGKMDEYRES
ncbi:MAG: CHAT domain-containing protein [Nitrospirota bacterium]